MLQVQLPLQVFSFVGAAKAHPVGSFWTLGLCGTDASATFDLHHPMSYLGKAPLRRIGGGQIGTLSSAALLHLQRRKKFPKEIWHQHLQCIVKLSGFSHRRRQDLPTTIAHPSLAKHRGPSARDPFMPSFRVRVVERRKEAQATCPFVTCR